MSSDLTTIPSAAGFVPGLRDDLCLQGAPPRSAAPCCGGGTRLQPAPVHTYAETKQANSVRRAAISAAHPESEALCVPRPDTALYVIGVVAAQIAVAVALEGRGTPRAAMRRRARKARAGRRPPPRARLRPMPSAALEHAVVGCVCAGGDAGRGACRRC
jgi:hypothetical protein